MLKKYYKTWNKISNLLKQEFDSMPAYDSKFIRSKIRTYNKRININFHGNKIPEDNECCSCLSVTSLDCTVNIDEKYYLQIFLEECKYAVTKKRMIKSFNEELNLN